MSLGPIGLEHYLMLSSLLFVCGALCMATKRNAIGVLLSIELMLNGVNILFVAFSKFVNSNQDFAGQIFAVFIMTVAAAEAAIGLAIVIAVYRLRKTVAVDELDLMKG